MDILDRISMLLKGREQQELTKYLKLNSVAFSEWKSGKSKSYRKYLIEIAEFFNVSLDYLVYGIEKSTPADDKSAKVQLTSEEEELLNLFSQLSEREKQRLIGRAELLVEQIKEPAELRKEIPQIVMKHSLYMVSAGKGFDLDEGDSWDEISIPDTHEARKSDFCITVSGDSMEPRFSNGDIVLVQTAPSVDEAQIGIFRIGQKGYIKEYGGDRLISLNPEYDDIIFEDYSSEDIQCCGLVLGVAETGKD